MAVSSISQPTTARSIEGNNTSTEISEKGIGRALAEEGSKPQIQSIAQRSSPIDRALSFKLTP